MRPFERMPPVSAWIVLAAMACPAMSQTSAPAAKTQPSEKVAATVNGEPILEKDLLAGLPEDAFESTLQAAKQLKLQRLVEMAFQRQFLKERKVEISREQLDQGMDEFTKMVQTPGCPCCGGGYKDLDEFMKVNGYTLPEVQQRVTCEIGFRTYVERVAKERITPETLAKEVAGQRARIVAEFVKGSILTFEYFQDPNYLRDPKGVRAAKERLAGEAYARLQKGEAFEKVAKAMSADPASAARDGQLAGVSIGALGPEVAAAWRKLEPGQFSKPIKTSQGYWIVKPEKLGEEEVVSLVKDQVRTAVGDQVYDEYKAAKAKAKIQYADGYAAK